MTSADEDLSHDLEAHTGFLVSFQDSGTLRSPCGVSLLALFTVCGSPKGKSSASVCNSHPQGTLF